MGTGTSCDDPPQLRWLDFPGAQRQELSGCSDNRGYGGTQTRRVLSHPETLHLQADQEQVEGDSHGIGAKPSSNDDTTEKDFVKYLYSTALGIEEFGRL